MEWQIIVAMAIAIPVILFPAAFVWFLNISGILTVWKESRARELRRKGRAAHQKGTAAVEVEAK
jgi:hypothetical protein